ncbi:hypothetical protein EVAR_70053_1 [Eumeta japonica]|uniref:Uncharacterized protein n=1 Tax=Eumeta variegata TaxID=151549 RepID=A0A4C1T8W5_EUMVA|nr:hypothetical protein EVAR_70053_1 [Eumeta japonica]
MSGGLAVTQLFRIQHLRNKIKDLAENIVNAKTGMILPNLISPKEVEMFSIDRDTFQGIKTSLVEWVNDNLSIIILIPAETIETNQRLLMPIPNGNNLQIKENPITVVSINNKTYDFVKGKSFFELKAATSCVSKGKCLVEKNLNLKIWEISSSMVILINTNNTSFHSSCDERELEMNGHYFLHFNNCSVTIGNVNFKTEIYRTTQAFALPAYKVTLSTERTIVYRDIELQQQNNLDTIEELKFYNQINTGLGGVAVVIIIGLVVAILVLRRSRGVVKVRITKKQIHNGNLRNSEIDDMNSQKVIQ